MEGGRGECEDVWREEGECEDVWREGGESVRMCGGRRGECEDVWKLNTFRFSLQVFYA